MVVVCVSTSDYKKRLTEAMLELSLDERVVFLGQGVAEKGTFMSMTLENIPRAIELPVAEEMQLGMSIGLALEGRIPVSVFPRWNFLILAANQLVNHLDKMQAHVIVRVGAGSTKPLYPGPQHVGNYAPAFESICKNTRFVTLDSSDKILHAYRQALAYNGPTVLTEIADEY